MKKYKICPVCGAHNNPLFLECADCETDLQSVPVTDEASEALVNPPQPEPTQPEMVRICDCGAKNPVQARRCSACGEDISTVMPTPDTETAAEPEPPCCVLASLDGSYAYDIPEGTTLIGRENEMKEHLADKPYVSRTHGELIRDPETGAVSIRGKNATNGIFINNRRIGGEDTVTLNDGDEVALGGNQQNGTRQEEAAYFIVRIGSCT